MNRHFYQGENSFLVGSRPTSTFKIKYHKIGIFPTFGGRFSIFSHPIPHGSNLNVHNLTQVAPINEKNTLPYAG